MNYEKLVMMLALASVAGILVWGLVTMTRGGDYNRNNSNKIMRYRVILQAVALLIFILILWFREPRG